MPRFDPNSFARVARAVKNAEQAPASGEIPPRRAGKAAQVRPAMLAKLLTPVTARSGADPTFTLGTGTAKRYWVNPSTRQTSAAGKTIAVSNVLDVEIPSLPGPVVLVWVDGLWIVAVGDCFTP